MRRMFFAGAGTIAILFSFHAALHAQILGARLEGVIRDPSQSVIPAATVTVTNLDTSISRAANTDVQGRYVFNDLPPGKYKVASSVSGFKTTVRDGVTLTVGSQITLDLTMEVGGVAEQVTITGEAPLVETQSGTVAGVVEEKVIKDLPLNGRSFANLAQLEPGVIITRAAQKAELSGLGDKMSLGGARPHQMSFLLDGADIVGKDNTTPSGVSGVMMGVDTIQEFRVSTSSFSAEFGRNSGGVISAITKSGTNDFHGTAYEFLRNSALDARNFFDQGSPAPLRRNQFGATVGGPIRKDKTFIFGGYEGLRWSLGNSAPGNVPTAQAHLGILPTGTVQVAETVKPYLALYPLPNGPEIGGGLARFFWSAPQQTRQDDFTIRLDHQLTNNDSLTGRVFFDDSHLSNPTSLGLLRSTDAGRLQSYVAEYKRIFGAATVNDFRVTFNRSALTLDDQIPDSFKSLEFIPGRNFGVLNQLGGFASISTQSTNPRFWFINTFQYIDDAVVAHGRHTFKFGGLAQRIQLNQFSVARVRGEFQFSSLATFLAGQPSRFEAGSANSGTRGLRQWLYGVYFQDDFRPTSRLTLNLGVRYELVTVPTEAAGRISTLVGRHDAQVTVGGPWWKNPGYKNFAPRIGFAYGLTGDGKTSLRGGYGIFYDQLLPIYWRDSNTRMPPFISRFIVTPANVAGGVIPFPTANNLFKPGPVLSDPNLQLDLAAPFHTHQPYTMQFNFTFQRQLASNLSLTMAYLGSQSRHNSRNVNLNTCAPAGFVNGNDPVFAAGCRRQNPNFAVIFQHLFDANANYNSLQLALKKKYSHGLNFDFVYQYGRTMDMLSGIAGSTDFQNTSFSMDPENGARDYSRAAFDNRHYVIANFTYEFTSSGAGPFRHLLGGWRISSLTNYSSGEPFTVANAFDRSGAQVQVFGFQERPNVAPGGNNNPIGGTSAGCAGVAAGSKAGTPDLYFDPCQFELQPAGRFGNLGRNTLQSPNLVTEDVAVMKTFALAEVKRLEFRWELFNLFNRANFDQPTGGGSSGGNGFTAFLNATTRNPNAGRISATRTAARQMQFGLKFIF